MLIKNCLLAITIFVFSYLRTNLAVQIQVDNEWQHSRLISLNNTNVLNSLCRYKETGMLLPYPRNCSKFIECNHGLAYSFDCPKRLYWNDLEKRCDYQRNVNCTRDISSNIITQQDYYDDRNIVESDTPIPHPNCPSNEDPSNPTQLPYPGDCNKFYKCLGGNASVLRCPPGLHWSIELNRCEWPSVANCTWGSNGNSGNNNGSSTNATVEQPHKDWRCPWYDNPEYPTHLPHPSDCRKFYKCYNGYAYPQDCPRGLYWNNVLKVCDWSSVANCTWDSNGNSGNNNGSSTNATVEQPYKDLRCPSYDNPEYPTHLPHPWDCRKFYKCYNGYAYPQACPNKLYWNNVAKDCDWFSVANCTLESRIEISTNETSTIAPVEQPHKDSRCPSYENPEYPTHLPNLWDCRKFYKCYNGYAYPQVCPSGLYWNNVEKVCDWPNNASCINV